MFNIIFPVVIFLSFAVIVFIIGKHLPEFVEIKNKAEDEKSGGVVNGPLIYNSSSCHHKPSIIRLNDEGKSKKLLKKFFQNKRKNKGN